MNSKIYGLNGQLQEAQLALSQAIDQGRNGDAIRALAECYRIQADIAATLIVTDRSAVDLFNEKLKALGLFTAPALPATAGTVPTKGKKPLPN